jgi:hypothetical protein
MSALRNAYGSDGSGRTEANLEEDNSGKTKFWEVPAQITAQPGVWLWMFKADGTGSCALGYLPMHKCLAQANLITRLVSKLGHFLQRHAILCYLSVLYKKERVCHLVISCRILTSFHLRSSSNPRLYISMAGQQQNNLFSYAHVSFPFQLCSHLY